MGFQIRQLLRITFVMVSAASGAAQEPRTFDAASIREAAPAATTGGGMRLTRAGDIRVDHMTAKALVGIAHQIDAYRVVNAPSWANDIYFDVVARANAASSRDDTFAMMRSMLADRFKLATHREMRSLDGFALVRASASGPGLKPSANNCEENPRGPRCAEGAITPTSFVAFGLPIANVVKLLTGMVRAPIVDRTGLDGAFDVDLHWSPEASPTDDTPVISTAVQEQLGLRLRRESVPTEVLVIDHIERPSEN